jgi:hypothetical protein
MLFHLAYVSFFGGLLPTVIRTGAKIGFGVAAARKLKSSRTVDANVIFSSEELDTFRKSQDVEELCRLHHLSVERGERNGGDEFCSHCGCAKTSVLNHCFNSQMILLEAQWNEMDVTMSADRYRQLIALGRRNASDFRGVYRDAILGFDTCPACGASRSAKTLQNTE